MQKPYQLATWSSEKDFWENGEDIFGHSDVYSETWPTSGTMRNGAAYALPTWEPRTDDSASSSLQSGTRNLPPPTTREHKDNVIRMEPHRPNDTDTLARALVVLLPTVTTSEATGSGNGPNKTGGDNLRTVVTLLPSPRASEGEKGGPNMRGSKGDLMLSSAVHRLAGESTSPLYVGGKPCEEPPLPLSN